MPTLMYEDPDTGEFLPLEFIAQGPQGDTGPQGPPGQAGNLNALSDVTVDPGTPAGKILGTTGTDVWGPVDPPAEPDLGPYATTAYVDAAIADFATVEYVDGRIWKGTQAQYDLIAPGEAGVLHVILPG